MIRSPDDPNRCKWLYMSVFSYPWNFFNLYFANQLHVIKSPFMPPEPDDLQKFVNQQVQDYGYWRIKVKYHDWEGKNDCSIQKENLDIAKNELELK